MIKNAFWETDRIIKRTIKVLEKLKFETYYDKDGFDKLGNERKVMSKFQTIIAKEPHKVKALANWRIAVGWRNTTNFCDAVDVAIRDLNCKI